MHNRCWFLRNLHLILNCNWMYTWFFCISRYVKQKLISDLHSSFRLNNVNCEAILLDYELCIMHYAFSFLVFMNLKESNYRFDSNFSRLVSVNFLKVSYKVFAADCVSEDRIFNTFKFNGNIALVAGIAKCLETLLYRN